MRRLLLILAALLPLAASAVSLKRVSVHDPSIVWDPTSQTYYIFGSHRASAKTKDLMSWTAFKAPRFCFVSGSGDVFLKTDFRKIHTAILTVLDKGNQSVCSCLIQSRDADTKQPRRLLPCKKFFHIDNHLQFMYPGDAAFASPFRKERMERKENGYVMEPQRIPGVLFPGFPALRHRLPPSAPC